MSGLKAVGKIWITNVTSTKDGVEQFSNQGGEVKNFSKTNKHGGNDYSVLESRLVGCARSLFVLNDDIFGLE